MSDGQRVLLPVSSGVNSIELATLVDVFHRAGLQTTVAAVTVPLDAPIVCSTPLRVMADSTLAHEHGARAFDMVVLAGGGRNAQNLIRDASLLALLREEVSRGRSVAAICSAPIVLAAAGLLENRRVTSFDAVRHELEKIEGLSWLDQEVVEDGPIITGRGPGASFDFAFRVVSRLCGASIASRVNSESILYRHWEA